MRGIQMETVVELEVYSPRWGHNDTYTFTLKHEFMDISMQGRSARCSWRENRNPEWSGEPLQNIFENDSIYPPAIFQKLVEYVWKEWRSKNITDQKAETEFVELATWLNAITKSKPQTDFWKKYF